MELLAVLGGSFIAALAIGYFSVASEHGVRIVAESKIGNKIGRWLFLFPVFDRLEHYVSRIFATETIERIRAFFILAVLSVVVVAAGYLFALSPVHWLWWLVIGFIGIAAYGVVKRPRL